MSYHIMEFYGATCRMSRLSRHPHKPIGFLDNIDNVIDSENFPTKDHLAQMFDSAKF